MSYPVNMRAGSIILLSAWLAACGGSGGGDSSGALSLKDFDGTWTSNCRVDLVTSFVEQAIIVNGTVNATLTEYTGSTCSGSIMTVENFTYSLALGKAVTVDGSVAGISVATEIDTTDVTPMSAQYGDVNYDLVAIQGNKLYFGDSSGANDGTTSLLRPTQLDDELVYTKN